MLITESYYYCHNKCKTVSFETKISYIKSFSNETILEIIPSKSPRIVYIETLKTNFNKLIFNCGGILSLWFGLSPISATDLLIYFLRLIKYNINKIIALINIIANKIFYIILLLKYIFSLIVILIINFFISLINNSNFLHLFKSHFFNY